MWALLFLAPQSAEVSREPQSKLHAIYRDPLKAAVSLMILDTPHSVTKLENKTGITAVPIKPQTTSEDYPHCLQSTVLIIPNLIPLEFNL